MGQNIKKKQCREEKPALQCAERIPALDYAKTSHPSSRRGAILN